MDGMRTQIQIFQPMGEVELFIKNMVIHCMLQTQYLQLTVQTLLLGEQLHLIMERKSSSTDCTSLIIVQQVEGVVKEALGRGADVDEVIGAPALRPLARMRSWPDDEAEECAAALVAEIGSALGELGAVVAQEAAP